MSTDRAAAELSRDYRAFLARRRGDSLQDALRCLRAICNLPYQSLHGVRSEHLCALLAERDRLCDALSEVRDLIDGYVDVLDGPEGSQRPNAAMRAQQRIDEALREAQP